MKKRKMSDIHTYIYIYIYIYIRRKTEKNVIQSEEFNVKESHCYEVSVLINHHQGFRNEGIECW